VSSGAKRAVSSERVQLHEVMTKRVVSETDQKRRRDVLNWEQSLDTRSMRLSLLPSASGINEMASNVPLSTSRSKEGLAASQSGQLL